MANSLQNGLLRLGLVVLTVGGLGQVCGHGFVHFDDTQYVFNNPMVMVGLGKESFLWAWTTFHMGFWQPLVWLSFQLDATLFRPFADSAWGFHWTNLVLHTVNVLLLFHLLRSYTGVPGKSALVAGLFAIHPQHVESVAWVTERKDVLSGIFMLFTMLAYSRYARNPSFKGYLPVLLFFFLGLGSKAILVTLPLVLLLWDFWPLGRLGVFGYRPGAVVQTPSTEKEPLAGNRKALADKVPLLLLSLAASLVTFHFHREEGALITMAWQERVAKVLANYGWFLEKTFWPRGLAILYPVESWSLSSWPVLMSLGVLAGTTALALWQWRRRPYLIVGWLWFLGMLVPVCGIVQPGTANHNDRFTYLPHIGLFIMVVWGLAEILTWARFSWWAQAILGCGLLGILLPLTRAQTASWKDTPTVMNHSLEVAGEDRMAYMALADYYQNLALTNYPQNVSRYWEKCLENADKSREIYEDEVVNFVIANAYLNMDDKDRALKHVRRAEDFCRAMNRPCHGTLAQFYARLGKNQETINHCLAHLQTHPGDVQVYSLLRKAMENKK